MVDMKRKQRKQQREEQTPICVTDPSVYPIKGNVWQITLHSLDVDLPCVCVCAECVWG